MNGARAGKGILDRQQKKREGKMNERSKTAQRHSSCEGVC